MEDSVDELVAVMEAVAEPEPVRDALGDTVDDAVAERVTSDARLRPSSTGSPPTNEPLRPAGVQPTCWARASHSAGPVAARASSAARCTALSTRMLGTAPVTLAYSAHSSRGESGA